MGFLLLSTNTISELQRILSEEFSYETSKEDVAEIATQMVGYIETLKEINDDEYAKTKNQ